jgi:2,3-bisphosphoglycerate-independent phosphoglycerate mutase
MDYCSIFAAMNSIRKCALVILDGWGIGDKSRSDAIFNAKTPFVDGLLKEYPNSVLTTFGESVGLPDGQMGNSEVGHLNIGAGRVVYQQLMLINRAFASGEIKNNAVLQEAIDYLKSTGKNIHLAGLVSHGGVHSSLNHLKGLCDLFEENNLHNVFIHCFLDGRDTDPNSGKSYVKELQNHIKGYSCKIASVVGRYYAMDRDQRWERVKIAYDLLVNGKGNVYNDPVTAIDDFYKKDITDEFMEPVVISENGESSITTVEEGDVFLCFNFRTDRGRQITRVLSQESMHEYNMHKLNLKYITMTQYDETYSGVDVIFGTKDIKMTMGEYLSEKGLSQIRAAETEKYPHVTFFFSGGEEKPFNNEKRLLVNSPKVATYDLQPEMSALELTDSLLKEFEIAETDFMCINFANTDMVGHTGVYSAITKAAETVDSCLQSLVETGTKNGYSFLIIADHGNADYAVNSDGSPNTAHSVNPVPCVVIGDELADIELTDGILADVAPTLLKMMNLEKPIEMTGNALY